jgi:large subunit ribosomal protein L28
LTFIKTKKIYFFFFYNNYCFFLYFVIKYIRLILGGAIMARKCYVTGLGTVTGNNRPHSLKASRRTWKANLQKVRIVDEDGKVKRVYVSTRALRSGLVKRA